MLVTDKIAELKRSIAYLEKVFECPNFKKAAKWTQKEYFAIYEAEKAELAEKEAYYLEHKEVFDSYVQPKQTFLW